MELEREFYKLPLQFDAERLQKECEQFGALDWIDHPDKHPGNAALILISVGGGINHEFSVAGQMAPTHFLERSPYLRQVLAAFETPFSRSRLMRLSPKHVVPWHDDVGYHWFRRVRVHIPIVTNPGVRFHCGPRDVHMGPGEAWIFDNFRPHMVENTGGATRIHLVADTRGSKAFWDLVARSEDPFDPATRGRAPTRHVGFDPSADARVEIEQFEFDVMPPDEVDGLLAKVFAEARRNLEAPVFETIAAMARTFQGDWRRAYGQYGNDRAGMTEYKRLLDDAAGTLLASPDLAASVQSGDEGRRALRVLGGMFMATNGMVTRLRTAEDPSMG